ncbi:hypothetical protein SAMN04487911_10351 [Arenibacter nanhaiticus]|uniref:Uncharacterized protein n=1 Tax=Arenibacter nanhaiticus TaxID=558155 RepID=A0A1M6C1N6_9FLAO|nr:hypothetical protein SAMN04487911_10351 [Arenibacter nanhaiticus]
MFFFLWHVCSGQGEDSLFNEIKLEHSKLYFKNLIEETPDNCLFIFNNYGLNLAQFIHSVEGYWNM